MKWETKQDKIKDGCGAYIRKYQGKNFNGFIVYFIDGKYGKFISSKSNICSDPIMIMDTYNIITKARYYKPPKLLEIITNRKYLK